jgi:hypothetical protein
MLTCGDPRYEPASFSRFVYPFAYKYSPVETSTDSSQDKEKALHYVPCDEKSFNASKEYFTPETNEVLFDSAKWFEMKNSVWANESWWEGIAFPCRGREITVSMLPPRLVLFEWPNQLDEKTDKKSELSLLRTGFLLVDLFFRKDHKCKPDLDDLLLINDYFRYFRCPYEAHAELFEDLLFNVPVEYGKQTSKKVGDETIDDNHAYLDRWKELLKFPISISNIRYSLNTYHDPPILNYPYADHRTYVWSAAILEEGATSLSKSFTTSNWQAHEYGHWIKLLNVDGPSGSNCPSKTHKNVMHFEKKWAQDRTYHRWEEQGIWYGFSYHGGVMLGPPWDIPAPPLWRHFRQMYFDMALLLFYIRISLFRFSRQLTDITPRSGKYEDKDNKNFDRLRSVFSVFTIRYQFPLLSNQQQAIEMYDLARRHFDLDALYKEVKEEINNTNEFLESKKQGQLTKDANLLARYGIPLAAASLVASLFGMGAKDYPILDWIVIFFKNCCDLTWWANLNYSRMTSISFLILLIIVCLSYWLSPKCFFRSPKADQERKDD